VSREHSTAPRAVQLELFANRFRGVVWQMGETLRRTALSVNVKERLDFSCALLDGDGRLVVNAPHIPVHLGALGPCVRSVVGRLALAPGDVAVTNHPAFGGSHLPDVTVITPVWPSGGARPSAYLASRAHHAEIGGSRPGSMPPGATCLAEEGVVLEPQLLVRAGRPRWQAIRARLADGRFPSRAVEENLVDLEAAVAANRQGAAALAALAAEHGEAGLSEWMNLLAKHAASEARAVLGRLRQGRFAAREELDDGTPLAVELEIADGGARIDFAGTAGVHPGNLNTTLAVVRSAVLYVLRLLVTEPLPLNEGLLAPVEIVVPRGLLNPDFSGPPESAPAVVGGNVETSQRLVDLLLKALEVVACSQGTMNNVVFGDERFGYYETVCGGAGAGPGFAGADAVHTHMTNTAITDPEVLEHRYPVRLERFAIRAGSGGRGRQPGGRGVIRELRFLAPVSLSLLTQHRRQGPYGLAGGGSGQTGRQRLLRAGGEVVELASVDGVEASSGDRLLLETPGGGGWGRPRPGDGEEAS
jgi:5-oxoprolinase (ATP-hydrolysing)